MKKTIQSRGQENTGNRPATGQQGWRLVPAALELGMPATLDLGTPAALALEMTVAQELERCRQGHWAAEPLRG